MKCVFEGGSKDGAIEEWDLELPQLLVPLIGYDGMVIPYEIYERMEMILHSDSQLEKYYRYRLVVHSRSK